MVVTLIAGRWECMDCFFTVYFELVKGDLLPSGALGPFPGGEPGGGQCPKIAFMNRGR